MPKPKEGEDHDYLAPAQLEINPSNFVQVVKEVYQVEFGVTEHQEIAEIIGVDKSRVSQVFKGAYDLQPKSLRALLEPVKKKSHRRAILKAWNALAFGEEIMAPSKARLTSVPPNQKALDRVDRMIREMRLDVAAGLARDIAEAATDHNIRERALDLGYWCNQRLDEPHKAMHCAKKIIEGARERQEPFREACGHLYRIRILIGLADSKPVEIVPLLEVADALAASPPVDSAPPYRLGYRSTVATYRESSRVTFMERGTIPRSQPFLEALRTKSLQEAKSSRHYQKKYHAWQLVSRIELLLGNTFAAAEAVDKAFETKKLYNLNALEMSGLLMGRVMAEDDPISACGYLKEVSENCSASKDLYHKRLVDWKLTRVLSETI